MLDSKVVDDNNFKYKFFDNVDKRTKFAKIYSPFSHLKSGLLFQGISDAVKNNSVIIQLTDDYKKIRAVYLQDINTKWSVGMLLYGNLNVKLVKERQSDSTNKWYRTNPSLVWNAEIYSANFKVDDFLKYLYLNKIFGKGYHVVGTRLGRSVKGSKQPFIQHSTHLEIRRNERFYVFGRVNRDAHTFPDSVLNDCTSIGNTVLTDHDRAEINKLYPNFYFRHLNRYESHSRATRRTNWKRNDVFLFPSTSLKIKGNVITEDFKNKFMKFEISNKKYKDWLNPNDGIFFSDSLIDIPDTLVECEKLFDKNILEIKKLVNEIGEINDVVANEQLNLALYDDSNLTEETHVQRVNKHL